MFSDNSNDQNVPFNSQGRNQNQNWKSDAFINIFLPTNDGGRRKLGSIGLKMGKPSDRQIIEYLSADPSRINLLLANAEVDFRMADGSDSAGFVLPE